jgi:CrcB protein
MRVQTVTFHLNPGLRPSVSQVIDGITKLVFTLVVSMSSVSFGSYLARISRSYLPRFPVPRPAVRYTLSVVGILIYAATFPAYAKLPPSYRSEAVASLLFSFPGTLSRYLLALSLNVIMKRIPLGTMAANVFGTGLLGVFHVLQNKHVHVSPHACSTLQGLIDGYCGALTTISTFVVELNAMEGSRYAWIYGGISILVSQLILLVIILPAHTLSNVPFIRSCAYEQ